MHKPIASPSLPTTFLFPLPFKPFNSLSTFATQMNVMEQSPTFTPIEEWGEFKLIKQIAANAANKGKHSLKGIGDDASVSETPADRLNLTSTDLFVHGVHFDLTYHPLQHLGFKCVVAAASDIYAMNGHPEQLYLSLALSNQFSIEMVELFYSGVNAACQEYGIELAGGDLTAIHRGFIINATVNGSAPREAVTYRKGAQENDLLCVSGDLGAAYLGLQLLEREKKVYQGNPEVQPELDESYTYLYQRFLKPDCRDDVIRKLAELDIKPTAMIDLSDGLSSDLLHLADQSEMGADIYQAKLPIHPAAVDGAEMLKLSPTTAALNGGEDYELLFSVPLEAHDKIKGMTDVSIIGHITKKENGVNLINTNNERIPLSAQGWDSYGNR